MVATGTVTDTIDAHHHVWDLAVRDQPWMTGKAMAPIARSFSVHEFAVEAARHGVTSSVVVQTVTDARETEELLDLAAVTPILAGVVGWVDVGAPDVGEQLDRLTARPGQGRLVGIRSMIQYDPDPLWLERPSVRAGMGEVASRGLVNELLIVPSQLRATAAAVAAVDDGRFVLDHLGKPPIASAEWRPWADDIVSLASNERVSVKISGLVTEADWSSWTAEDVRPYMDHALATFGAGRVIFGSDWPVCTLAASYGDIVALAAEFVAGLTTTEQAAILRGNAADVYSLDLSKRKAS